MNYADPRRWWSLAALALSVLVVGLDSTILSVALPTLAVDLDASTGQLQWITNSYTLVLAALLLPAGLLGDRLGRRRLLLVALAVFGVASAACAVAPSATALIVARAVLGLGAAFLMPLSMSVLTVIFSPEERPRAMSIWVMSTALSLPLGPILGGLLLDHLWWGSIFLINVPIVGLALVAVWRLLPESRSPDGAAVDALGIATSGAGLVALTYGLIEAGSRGWGDARSLGAIVGGLALLGLFGVLQRRQTYAGGRPPMVDVRLFRSSSYLWGTLLATVVSFALFGVLFVAPQYFEAVEGADAFGTGLRLLPLIGGLVLGARVAGLILPRAGVRLLGTTGLLVLTAGLLLGATTGTGSPYALSAAWLAVAGLGLGLSLPTLMDAALGALPPDRSGAGSGLTQALRQVGGAVGVAVLGSILNSGYRGRLEDVPVPADVAAAVHDSASAGVRAADALDSEVLLGAVREAFVHGMGTMLLACAGVALVGAALAATRLPRHAQAHAGANAGATAAPPVPLGSDRSAAPALEPAAPGPDAATADRTESRHDAARR
jgi:EmrB/QacA subfamily drug resistance transporter